MNKSLQSNSLVIKDPNVNIREMFQTSSDLFFDVNDLYFTLPPGGDQDAKMLAPFAVFYLGNTLHFLMHFICSAKVISCFF